MEINQNNSYDRSYYEGRVYVGEGYRDFLWHQYTVNEVLKRKPASVIDFGCGRGYIVKHLIYHGIDAWGVDGSKHCFDTRASSKVLHGDLLSSLTWKGLGTYNLGFSMAYMEHIPEDKVPFIISNMIGRTERGLHGITFEDPKFGDPTHVTLKPKEWWIDQFRKISPKYPVEIFEKTELERPLPGEIMAVSMGNKTNGLKLNIGSHVKMFYYGWLNIDIQDLTTFAKVNGYDFKRWDIRRGIPLPDNSVQFIVTHHTFEHLTRADGIFFLQECLRVLMPKGIVRIGIPDLEILARLYVSGRIRDLSSFSIEVENAKDDEEAFFNLATSGHPTGYTGEGLRSIIESLGFKAIISTFDKSLSPEIEKETVDSYPLISSFVEGIKKEVPAIEKKQELIERSNAFLRRS